MNKYFFILAFIFFSHPLLATNCDSIVVSEKVEYTPFHYWDTTITTYVYNGGLLRNLINYSYETHYFYDSLNRVSEEININRDTIASKRDYYYTSLGNDSAIIFSAYNGQYYFISSGSFFSYDVNNNLEHVTDEHYDTLLMQWDTTLVTIYTYSADSLTQTYSAHPYPGNVEAYGGSTTWDSLGRDIAGSSHSGSGMYSNSHTYSYDSLCSGFSVQYINSFTGGSGGYSLYRTSIWFYDGICRPVYVVDTEWTYPSNPTPPHFNNWITNYYYADCNNIIAFGTDTVVTCMNQSAAMNVNVYGGTGPYTFSWTSQDSLSDASIQNPMVFTDSGTTCNMIVTDSLGNQAQFNAVVAVNHFTATVTDASCDTCSNGSVELLFPSLHPAYDLIVSPDSGYWNGNVLSGLYPGTYTIVSNSSGCDYSETMEVHYPTGIRELNEENLIHVFPNPAGDYFNVKIDFIPNEPVSWTLRSIDGRKLISATKTQTEFQVPVENLVSGIYFLEVVSGFKSVIKVIKE